LQRIAPSQVVVAISGATPTPGEHQVEE